MLRAIIVFCCLVASHFATEWIFSGVWQKALVSGVLAALVFSVTLVVVSSIVRNSTWSAFWWANVVLFVILGGVEFYGLAIRGTNATRWGGARLFDGQITLAGWMSLFFDIGTGVLSNLLGFYLAEQLMKRLNRLVLS